MSDFNQFIDIKCLPDWVQWIAQDANGCWWGYEAEPNQCHNGWYENEVGDSVLLERGVRNPGWIETLSRVGR